jgi:hypothetical protein
MSYRIRRQGGAMKRLMKVAMAVALAIPLQTFAYPEFRPPLQRDGALYLYASNADNKTWHCNVTWTLTYQGFGDGQETSRNAEFRVPPNVNNALVLTSSSIEGTNFQLSRTPDISCN